MNTKDAVIAWHVMGNAPKAYWYATTAAIAHPASRKFGMKMAGYGARVTLNVARASAGAALRTPLVAGGATTAGSMLGAVAAGYAIGATIGTSIAYAGWGESGAKDAIDLYTGGVSFDEYFDTVGNALRKSF